MLLPARSRIHPDRLSERPRRQLSGRRVLLPVMVLVVAVSAWWLWPSQENLPTAADREQEALVRDYLQRTGAYADIITGITVRDWTITVHTNLDHGSTNVAVARGMYTTLWREVALAHPERGGYRVVILDLRGRYLDGGVALRQMAWLD
jgi:hypothetical protein